MKVVPMVYLLLSVSTLSQGNPPTQRADRPSRPSLPSSEVTTSPASAEVVTEQVSAEVQVPNSGSSAGPREKPDDFAERGSEEALNDVEPSLNDVAQLRGEGLDRNDQNLKKLAFSEVTSFKVSRDTQQCTVVLAQNIKRQPFDLTLKRSAAKFDSKATEVNQAAIEASNREARLILAQDGDPQVNTYRAQVAADVATQAVTVRSKFWNKITQMMYGTASLNSYLKDLQIGRYRKSCHKEIYELSPNDCSGKATDIVKKIILQDVFLGKVDARDKENRYKQMMSGLELAKNCKQKSLVKKCKKYLREVEEDLAFCKESLPSSNSSTFINFLNDLVNETLFIKEAHAGSREGRFGTYGEAILTHIESDPMANSQNFITDPYNRGSLSYSMNKAKKSGTPGLDYLRRVQQGNIEEVEGLASALTNGDNLILTEAVEPLRNATEFNANLNMDLANLAGLSQSSFSGVNEFKQVKSSDPTTEFAILGKQAPKVNNLMKGLQTVLNDFDTGKAFTAEGYQRQEELIKDLPYLEKLLEKVKSAAEKERSDLSRNGKKGYQERDFSEDMIAALKRSGLSERDLIAGILPLSSGLDKVTDKESSKKETIVEKTQTITITKGNDFDVDIKDKDDEDNITGIVTDASVFEPINLGDMREVVYEYESDIHKSPKISIWEIISRRYILSQQRLLPEDAATRYDVEILKE